MSWRTFLTLMIAGFTLVMVMVVINFLRIIHG